MELVTKTETDEPNHTQVQPLQTQPNRKHPKSNGITNQAHCSKTLRATAVLCHARGRFLRFALKLARPLHVDCCLPTKLLLRRNSWQLRVFNGCYCSHLIWCVQFHWHAKLGSLQCLVGADHVKGRYVFCWLCFRLLRCLFPTPVTSPYPISPRVCFFELCNRRI